MKFFLIASLALFATASSYAKLVEDGSTFTGHYRSQEATKECYEKTYDPYRPSVQLDGVDIKGTPEGLVVEQNLLPIGYSEAKSGDGFFNSNDSEYVSSTVFTSKGKFSFEGQTTTSEGSFIVQPSKNILVSGKTVNPDGSVTYLTCHLIREN